MLLYGVPYHATGTERERFWRRVKRGPGCWLWTGNRNVYGYGVWSPTKRAQLMAHRVAFVFAYGSIPVGKNVLHRCDNPPCVRPTHLFTGTQKDNSLDMMRKGRGVFPNGERNGRAILTATDVRNIRRIYKPQRFSPTNAVKLARKYGVSQTCVYSILSRKRWKHI